MADPVQPLGDCPAPFWLAVMLAMPAAFRTPKAWNRPRPTEHFGGTNV